MIRIFVLFLTFLCVIVNCHVDDVFYIDSTTTDSVTIAWYGESNAVDKVKEWKILLDDVKKHYGSPDELTQTSSITFSDVQAEPGESVKVTVTVTKTDDSIVHPLLNAYAYLQPLPVDNLMIEQEATSNDLAGSGKLSWTLSMGSNQDGYNVRYKGTHQTPTEWSNVREVDIESWTFTGLTPGELYQFQVTARSRDVESDAAFLEQELHPGHVTNVQMKSLDDGFSLKWEMPPGIVHKMEAYVDPYEEGCEGGTVRIHDDEAGANIYGLTRACTYIIHICAVSRNGLKGKSVDVAGTTVPKIYSKIQLREPAPETSATLIYSESNATFDYYFIKLRTHGDSHPSFDKEKRDPFRSVTFAGLTPGTIYTVEMYAIIRQRAGAPPVSSAPYFYTFTTAGDPPGSEDNQPIGAIIALSVVVVILLIVIIILAICLYKKRQINNNTQPSTMNNKLNSRSNVLRHQGSINTAGPQPMDQTTSYIEIIDDGRINKDSLGYEKPVPFNSSQETETMYEELRKSGQAYENFSYTK